MNLRLFLLCGLLPLFTQRGGAREYARIILMLGGEDALGAPQASETRMSEIPLGTHPAEMWKQVPFAFAGDYSHSISSGTGIAHIPVPPPDDPMIEPRTWWQTLTRQPTCDPQKSHWGAEIGLGRELYDRGYRNFRIIKYTYHGGKLDDTFKTFMNDVLAFPAFDKPSFTLHPFELAALVYFQKPQAMPGKPDQESAPVNVYRQVKAILPQTRHMKMFVVAHPGNPAPPLSLRPGLYQLIKPEEGDMSQMEIENISTIVTHDLPQLPAGGLNAEGLMSLGQRLAHQLVLYRALRPPEARSVLVHHPAQRMVSECFVDEKGQPKLQAGAYRQIDYYYAHGRVTRMVFDGKTELALNFTYSGENTLDQVYDPQTKSPLYLSAAGEYAGANGLPMCLPMLPAAISIRNGVGRCASSPMSPWLWFAMTHDLRSVNSDLTLAKAAKVPIQAEDGSLVLAPFQGSLHDRLSPLVVSDTPPGPWPPGKLMPSYAIGGLRGSFGRFHTFKYCCCCDCSPLLYPLTLKLPPIVKPNFEPNFFDPTIAALPTPVQLRRTYEGKELMPALSADLATVPLFLVRKLELQQAQCPSLVPTSRIAGPDAPRNLPAQQGQATHTGLFVPFPMETAQYLERLTLPAAQTRKREQSVLKIKYETIEPRKAAHGHREAPVEFMYSNDGLATFAATRIETDEAGRIVRETYLDSAGNPAPGPDAWSMKVNIYSVDGLLLQTSYLDCKQRLCYNADGYSEVVHTYNTHRQLLSTEYFSPNGMLVPQLKSGYSAVDMSYLLGGELVREKRYYNANNCLAKQKWGYAGIQYHYDKLEQNLESIRFFDTKGEPCAHVAGHFGVSYTYRHDRLLESECFLDAKGDPMMTIYGYARVAYEYDTRNRLVATRYLDAGASPCTTIAGYNSYLREYDDAGNLRVETYSGSGARPIRTPWVWARKDYTYNSENRLIDEKFYNIDGTPVSIDTGYCRITYAYDPAGNLTTRGFTDANGRLALGPERYALMRNRYDETNPRAGRKLETTFFGHQGVDAIAVKAGYAGVKYQYNTLNQCVQEDYFDLAGEAGAKPVAYVSSTLKYDEFGREIHREYRSSKGAERIGPEGYFSQSLTYDRLGRITETAYLDCARKWCAIGAHFARMTRSYSSDGVSFQEQYFSDAARLVNSAWGIPGRMLAYEPRGKGDEPPLFNELYRLTDNGVAVPNRYGYAGRVFQFDLSGQIERETYVDEKLNPTQNSLGYREIRFEAQKGLFARNRGEDVARPDGNSFVELTTDGDLTYSARSPEGFRRRATTPLSAGGHGLAAPWLNFETPEQTHFHPFRHYTCRACGEQRSYGPSELIVGPERFAREVVFYQKNEDLYGTPVAGFTNIWTMYEDAAGVPVMNQWNYMRVDQAFDDLGQLISESFYDTRNEPVINTGGFSKVEYQYKNGLLVSKTFIAEARPPNGPTREAQAPESKAQRVGQMLKTLLENTKAPATSSKLDTLKQR